MKNRLRIERLASFLAFLVFVFLSWMPSAISQEPTKQKLRVVVLGGHPDDPESGCGGLIAILAQAGHDVRVGYTTCFRGDRKIGGEPEAIVRRREATAACKILLAKK